LNSDTSEYRAIVQEFLKKALAHPDVSFELSHNNELKYQLLESVELLDRIVDLFPDLKNILQPFSYQESGVHAYGFLSDPSWYKPTRTYQYLFVNGRAIDWIPFKQQISIAYGNMLPPSKFPAVFCYLEIDPCQIDFNVHPQKREIRFEQEKLVSDIVRRAIRLGIEKAPNHVNEPWTRNLAINNSLESNLSPNTSSFTQRSNRKFSTYGAKESFFSSGTLSYKSETKFSSIVPTVKSKLPKSEQLVNLFERQVQASTMADILMDALYLGTCFQTYLIFEYISRLYLVDFHAMHERIRYEKIIAQKEKGLESQTIIPLLFELPKHDAEYFEEISPALFQYGFQMHRISETAFSVEAIPVIVSYPDALNVLRELFVKDISTLPWDESAKMIACKGSVRSGDRLSYDEVGSLLFAWKECQNPSSCPHGRPIVVSLDKIFFDKEFKRTGF
ncbi:MAG: DNA mismatch repair endonuclease MutL, partial [Brevinema sp.]